MAFNSVKLSRIYSASFEGGRNFSRFVYATKDPISAVIADGYFDDAATTLHTGDIIEVYSVSDSGLKISYAGIAAIKSGKVTAKQIGADMSLDFADAPAEKPSGDETGGGSGGKK